MPYGVAEKQYAAPVCDARTIKQNFDMAQLANSSRAVLLKTDIDCSLFRLESSGLRVGSGE